MTDQFLHDNDPEFSTFLEETLKSIGENAQVQSVCMECLSDRLVVELVCGMVRSGVSVSDILAMVGEGIEAAEAGFAATMKDSARRMH